jgi:hypothetical protein
VGRGKKERRWETRTGIGSMNKEEKKKRMRIGDG